MILPGPELLILSMKYNSHDRYVLGGGIPSILDAHNPTLVILKGPPLIRKVPLPHAKDNASGSEDDRAIQ